MKDMIHVHHLEFIVFLFMSKLAWNSAHLVETPRQRPAAVRFRSLTFAAPH
ncbi:hypothetical protein [Burkholderia aenigmatica]|uniref:hypothetical protein n=1 Tax=Burkholderia aenigmatica TaxID=2015348 RepID=UPI0015C5E4A0|nr:hypothetical protein [Burkholderia aenigmatica]